MEATLFLKNINSYIKYAYMLVAIVIIFVLIRLLLSLINLGKSFMPITNSLNNINESTNKIKEKANIINDSLSESLPFFLKVVATLKTLEFLYKFSKRKDKRNVKTLLKYPKQVNQVLTLSKEIVSFIKEFR